MSISRTCGPAASRLCPNEWRHGIVRDGDGRQAAIALTVDLLSLAVYLRSPSRAFTYIIATGLRCTFCVWICRMLSLRTCITYVCLESKCIAACHGNCKDTAGYGPGVQYDTEMGLSRQRKPAHHGERPPTDNLSRQDLHPLTGNSKTGTFLRRNADVLWKTVFAPLL